MYGIPCAHCGHKELFHVLKDDIGLYQNKSTLIGGWSLEDYGEEFDGVDDLHKHQKGYAKNFNNCPGFDYPKRISTVFLARRALDYPGTIHFVEKDVKEKAKKIFENEESRKTKNSDYSMSDQRAVYIIVDRNGTSRCFAGD